MKNEPTNLHKQHEALIDALLKAAYAEERSAVANKVDQVIKQIELEKIVPNRPTIDSTQASRRTWNHWVPIAIAASLISAMFIGLQYLSPAKQALAAIERSLEVAEEKVARRYLITVTLKDESKSFEAENDLYVEGNDRFALRHSAIVPGSDLWIGKNGDTTWVVPAIGPVLTGNDFALSRWLSSQEQFSTPYLHVTTILARMSRGYQLHNLGESTIRSIAGSDVFCRHLKGELKSEANQSLPATIELWSDVESGMAIRIEARWPLSGSETGREKVVLEFVEQPILPDHWFEADGHFSGTRSKITFDTRENE